MDTPTLNHISLCAGYGGIDLGLKRAVPNLRTIAFSEIEAFPCANLVAKVEAGLLDPAPIWTDLRTFPFAEFHGLVDVISGGFPCQPFSAAGKRGADEDPRHLFPAILDGIRAAQPALVFLENVEGIISAKLAGDEWRDPAGTPVLLHVLRELERVGYCATAGIFSASEVGAPHQRKRVFILARRNGAGLQGLRGERGHGQGSGEEQAVGSSGNVWPSRPGQPQFDWEPPRVVANAHCKQSQRGRNAGELEQASGTEQSETQERQRSGDAVGDQSSAGVGVGNTRVQESSGLPTGSGRNQVAETGQSSDGLGNAHRGGQPSCLDARGSEKADGRGQGYVEPSDVRQIEPAVGGDAHGPAHRLGHAELFTSSDNRTDELRLLGNGVVPATAERAFLILLKRLS